MSRSIHTTWRKLINEKNKQEEKKKPENPKKIKKMYKDLRKKRQIKNQVLKERKDKDLYIYTNPDDFPVYFEKETEYFHYPITEEDIKYILKMLPIGTIDGLSCIKLMAGVKRQQLDSDADETDPYTNRLGYKIFLDVYTPPILGTYYDTHRKIEIYAFVYKELPDFRMWNIVLKLQMLMTFVHEVYHHYDFYNRIGQGKWLGNENDKAEIYAEKMEYKWLCEVIIPYLEEKYRNEVMELKKWIRSNAGIELPLLLLAGDPRKTVKGGFVLFKFSTSSAFDDFVTGVYKGHDIIKCRIELARDLHYADIYDLSLSIIETVLENDLNNIEALVLKADIYVHQEKYDEAERLAQKILVIKDKDFDTFLILCDVYEEQLRWDKVLEFSKKAIDLADNEWQRENLFLGIAKALKEVGQIEEAKIYLDKLENVKRKHIKKRADELMDEIIKLEN